MVGSPGSLAIPYRKSTSSLAPLRHPPTLTVGAVVIPALGFYGFLKYSMAIAPFASFQEQAYCTRKDRMGTRRGRATTRPLAWP